jgi:hypothetical protein
MITTLNNNKITPEDYLLIAIIMATITLLLINVSNYF